MSARMNRLLTPDRLALLAQFLRFGTVGFAGFLADNAVVYTSRAALGLYLAGALSYLISATVTWALNRMWTFRGTGSGPAHRQWMLFLAANALGFGLNRGAYFTLITISPLCFAYPVLAILGGTIAGMFLNFYLSRRLVFR
jgi:putative flippase GtrA